MRYNEGLQGFSEDQLQKVTFGKSVLSVSEHFFVHGNVPHLTLVLQVGDAPRYENSGSYRPHDSSAPDPMEGMTDSQKSVFLALKTWRNEMAKEEGHPAYAIARNTQLAALVKSAPKTKAALKEIDGFGEAFCEKYGEKVLSLMAETPSVAKEMSGEKSAADAKVSDATGQENLPL